MTSFWTTILDWFLPSIRLSDDIHDLEALRYQNIIASSQTRLLGSSPARVDATGRHRDSKHERVSRGSLETETNGRRSRIVPDDMVTKAERLTEENERLKREVARLETQLQTQTQDRRVTLASPVKLTFPTLSSPPVSPTSAVTVSPRSSFVTDRVEQLDVQERPSVEAEAALRAFMDRTDATDGASLLQNVKDLNAQIQQFAANVAETYHEDLGDISFRKQALRRESPSHLEIVTRIVGEQMIKLLTTRDHMHDPIFLQYAIQAWEIGRAKAVFDGFCFGAPKTVDQTLSAMFKEIYAREPQTIAFRWRALSHTYLRSHLNSFSSIPPTPITPGSKPSFADPMNTYIDTHVEDDIVGVQVLLSLAGWKYRRTSLRDELLVLHRERLGLIYRQILKIEASLRQDYMSALYEMSVVPPAPASTRSDKTRLHIDVDSSRRSSLHFDEKTMENVLFGFGEQSGGVLCTVEAGLTLTEESTQQGVFNEERSGGSKRRSSPTRHLNVGSPEAINRTSSMADDTSRKFVTKVLLKPKVLLESIDKYYDGQAPSSM